MEDAHQSTHMLLNDSVDLHGSRPHVAEDRPPDFSRSGGADELVAYPSLTLLDIAWLLWTKRKWLAKVMLWGFVVATLIAFAIPKRYQAILRLMPPDYNTGASLATAFPAISQAAGGTGGAGGNVGGSAVSIANQLLGLNTSSDMLIGVLRSRTVEDRVIDRFNLMRVYGVSYREDARRELENRTSIVPDKKSGIITMSVEDHLPSRSAAILQAYVEELNGLLAKVNTSAAHRERVFLEGRLKELQGEMSADEKQFSEFASQNSAIDIPQQAKATVEGSVHLQAELMAAQSRLEGMEQIYTPQNIRVRQLMAQIDELHRQLDKLGGKGVNLATGGTLNSDELYPSLRQLPLLGVRYFDLYRQNQVDDLVFQLLTKQHELAKVQEAKDVPSIQILDPAELPEKKAFPHRLWIMLGGIFFSFALGVLYTVGGEVWHRADKSDPWKILVSEIVLSVKAHTWDTKPGKRFRQIAQSGLSVFRIKRVASSRP